MKKFGSLMLALALATMTFSSIGCEKAAEEGASTTTSTDEGSADEGAADDGGEAEAGGEEEAAE